MFNSLKHGQESRGGSVRRIKFIHTYEHIISVENLLDAWKEFVRGKHKRSDVQEFERYLMRNVFDLHQDLATETYTHGPYKAFKINDPKPRDIHKAGVRDRLVHHALYRQLYPFFDRTFIPDSYSCRKEKGTHRAMNRFRDFARKVSRNNTRTCWVLECDIRKFFALDSSLNCTRTKSLSRHLLQASTSSVGCISPTIAYCARARRGGCGAGLKHQKERRRS